MLYSKREGKCYQESLEGQGVGLDSNRQSKQNGIIPFLYAFFHEIIDHTFSDSSFTRNYAKRNAVIQIVIVTVAFIFLVRIFPMGVVKNHTISRQGVYKGTAKTGSAEEQFTAADKKLQTIFFADTHIEHITLYLNCRIEQGFGGAESVLFRLYNESFSCIYEEEVDSRAIEKKGFLTATPNLDVEIGKSYYYEILVQETSHATYWLPVADNMALGQSENSTLYIDGIINDEVSLVADFDYAKPLSAVGIIVRQLAVIFVALAIYCLALVLVWLYDRFLEEYTDQIWKCVRIGICVLSLLAAVVLIFFAVVFNCFGGEIWDRLFFLAGILVAELWLVGFLMRSSKIYFRQKDSKLVAGKKMCLVWHNYLQTVSFGLLFYALCQYANADRNYFHDTNTRWMLIFLAIAFLMNYHERRFVNAISAVWFTAGIVGSVFYCNTVRADDKELLLARLTCGVVLTWGLLLIAILLECLSVRRSNLKKRNSVHILHKITQNKQQTLFVVLWVLFGALMILYRFEKMWVFTATLPFVAYFFTRNTLVKLNRFLNNFCNGIFVSFALVTLFCLMHRPHHYWMVYRYGGIFHTVACTGMYLAVVFGAALAKLYGKLKLRKRYVWYCCPEYFVVACVMGFILLTMSRTAFLTVTVTLIAVVALSAVAYHKKIGRILSEFGILSVACLVSFPMVFTAVRMIPAVVNEPVRYDIEFQDKSFMIYEGDPIDSDKYMTVRRFFDTLFGRFQTQRQRVAVDTAIEDETKGLELEDAGELAFIGAGLAGLDRRAVDNNIEENATTKTDISNGRFTIFQDYWKAITLRGHPKMGPKDQSGSEYAHAHNSYLQVAYNFGGIAGVVFLVLCVLTLWRAICLYLKYGKEYIMLIVPFVLVVVFGFESLTEWTYHPCISPGFSFILIQVVLMRDYKDSAVPHREKQPRNQRAGRQE